jgi:hypothetical protein
MIPKTVALAGSMAGVGFHCWWRASRYRLWVAEPSLAFVRREDVVLPRKLRLHLAISLSKWRRAETGGGATIVSLWAMVP